MLTLSLVRDVVGGVLDGVHVDLFEELVLLRC